MQMPKCDVIVQLQIPGLIVAGRLQSYIMKIGSTFSATVLSLYASLIPQHLPHCVLHARTPLYMILLLHNHQLQVQWACGDRDWQDCSRHFFHLNIHSFINGLFIFHICCLLKLCRILLDGILLVILIPQLQHINLRHIQTIQNAFPLVDIQNLFDSMPCHIASLTAALCSYAKY